MLRQIFDDVERRWSQRLVIDSLVYRLGEFRRLSRFQHDHRYIQLANFLRDVYAIGGVRINHQFVRLPHRTNHFEAISVRAASRTKPILGKLG